MDARQHAHLARQLIAKCGGVDEIVRNKACRLKKSRLYELTDPTAGRYLHVDVIAELEAYCGEPVYSRALVEARPHKLEVRSLEEEACEATQRAARLQETVRKAAASGRLSHAQRMRIETWIIQLEQDVRKLWTAAEEGAA